MSLKQVHIFVEGRVQGVCFRHYTSIEARKYGLTGWVRNLSDGSVEVMAEGEEDVLREFVNFCKKGPAMACVRSIRYDFSDYTGAFSGFSITG